MSLGTHNLCVRASNSCDLEGQSICWEIKVIESPLKTDCTGAELLCDKKFRNMTFPGSFGLVNELNTGDFCFGNTYGETNSQWFTFDIKKAGKFWFTISPEDPMDIDFIIFKKKDEDGCYTKESVRCSYAGGGECNGDLGLSPDETDTYEGGGCNTDLNNFLAALDCQVGETYYMVILAYNTSDKRRYTMSFCGDALLSCDEDSTACIPLSVDQSKKDSKVRLYPNPNSGSFNLEPGKAFVGSIEIYDIAGIKVYEKKIDDGVEVEKIELMDPKPGFYNAIIRSSDHQIISRNKVVIK